MCRGRLQLAFKKYGYAIDRCSSCDLFKTRLKGTYSKLVKNYYDQGYFTGSKRRMAYADYEGDAIIDRKNFRLYLDKISHYKSSGRLLDIGCALGGFMEEVRELGWRVFGNDVSGFAVSIARKKFPGKVRRGDFAKLKYQFNSFDVITLWDVIEHLENPLIAVKKIRRILRPKGLVVLTTGDSASLTARIMGSKWFFFIPPQHLWVFNKTNLKRLLEANGFKLLASSYVGRSISLRHLGHQLKTIYPNEITRLISWLWQWPVMARMELYLNLFSTRIFIAQKI